MKKIIGKGLNKLQIWITDYNFYTSLNNLKMKHLFSMIYEGIHAVGSLLDIVDKLLISDKAKVQAKKLKNKVQCKLWKDHEENLISYLILAYIVWYNKFANKKKTIFSETINYKNLNIIQEYKKVDCMNMFSYPDWVTDELIEIHKSVLIQKEIDNENKLKNKAYEFGIKFYNTELFDDNFNVNPNHEKIRKRFIKIKEQIENNHHYRNLWKDIPLDLKMRYDFRKD